MRLFNRLAGRRTHVRTCGGPRRPGRPIIDMPAARVAPEHVVERLREVDATADLIYLGLGVWTLWFAVHNSYRTKIGTRLVASELARPQEMQSMGRLKMARLFQQGYRFYDFIDDGDIESGAVVREFRFADWRYRHMADAAFEENLKGSDDATGLQRRIDLLMDFNASEQRSIWQHVFKGRRSILQRGAA